MDWGVCTTVKAPIDQILAFIAWHKHLGAAHIWVHLDAPDPATVAAVAALPGVTAIACDEDYWQGERHRTQEARQSHNVQRIYQQAELPVLAHLDVDEFLWPARPMDEIIEAWFALAPNVRPPFLRAKPAEALHNPTLTDDIFTATAFRIPFPSGTAPARKQRILGQYADVLPSGMLSHRVGKSLFQTRVQGLKPQIHAAVYADGSKPGNQPFHPDLTVLHFHAQDPVAWASAARVRATTGAYRFNPKLAQLILNSTDDALADFYAATQTATPKLIAALRTDGLLVEANLALRDKVANLL